MKESERAFLNSSVIISEFLETEIVSLKILSVTPITLVSSQIDADFLNSFCHFSALSILTSAKPTITST